MHRKTDWSENRRDDKGEMSFSGMVKEELSRQIGLARHCKMAELAAILCSCGKMECFSGDSKLKIQTENEAVARKCFTLLQKTFNIETKIFVRENSHLKRVKVYTIEITDPEEIQVIFQALRLVTNSIDQGTLVLSDVLQVHQCHISFHNSKHVKQMEDIKLVRQKIGFEQLNEGLAQVAELRMQYPEATLKELGMMLSPQVGKSGVNHRLRKPSAMADELREKQGGELL